MNTLRRRLLAAIGTLALSATAQDTNLLKTAIGQFENRTGVVIIKAASQVGSIMAGPDEIFVRCKESTEAGTQTKAYGLFLAINRSQLLRERIYVDDDEIDPLLDVINYLSKISSDVTKLPVFEATYTTKSGLQLIARSERRNGGIRYFLAYNEDPRIEITPLQMTQLYDLVAQARKDLNNLKTDK